MYIFYCPFNNTQSSNHAWWRCALNLYVFMSPSRWFSYTKEYITHYYSSSSFYSKFWNFVELFKSIIHTFFNTSAGHRHAIMYCLVWWCRSSTWPVRSPPWPTRNGHVQSSHMRHSQLRDFVEHRTEICTAIEIALGSPTISTAHEALGQVNNMV